MPSPSCSRRAWLAALPAATLLSACETRPTPPRVVLAAPAGGRIERLAAPAWPGSSPRELHVWLPPGYDAANPANPTNSPRCPVLYLQDGQNLFDALAVAVSWRVAETAERLVAARAVPPFIVVGVANTPGRIEEYTAWPQRLRDGSVRGGGAAGYARFLIEAVKPAIDARYRTRPEREHTAVGGSSLGGLLSIWLLLKAPQVFGAGLVVSPSVWWAGEAILAEVAAAPATLPRPRIWLDIGTAEGDEALQGVRRLRDELVARGWPPQYLEAEGAAHDETAWAARVEPMLRFLYRPLTS